MKGVSKSQTKHINFEESKKCLDGGENQGECNNCILRSINHEMFVQKVKKNLHYHFSMIKDVMKNFLKVNQGSDTIQLCNFILYHKFILSLHFIFLYKFIISQIFII